MTSLIAGCLCRLGVVTLYQGLLPRARPLPAQWTQDQAIFTVLFACLHRQACTSNSAEAQGRMGSQSTSCMGAICGPYAPAQARTDTPGMLPSLVLLQLDLTGAHEPASSAVARGVLLCQPHSLCLSCKPAHLLLGEERLRQPSPAIEALHAVRASGCRGT